MTRADCGSELPGRPRAEISLATPRVRNACRAAWSYPSSTTLGPCALCFWRGSRPYEIAFLPPFFRPFFFSCPSCFSPAASSLLREPPPPGHPPPPPDPIVRGRTPGRAPCSQHSLNSFSALSFAARARCGAGASTGGRDHADRFLGETPHCPSTGTSSGGRDPQHGLRQSSHQTGSTANLEAQTRGLSRLDHHVTPRGRARDRTLHLTAPRRLEVDGVVLVIVPRCVDAVDAFRRREREDMGAKR